MPNFLTRLFGGNSPRSLKIESHAADGSEAGGLLRATSPQVSLRQFGRGALLEVDACYVRIVLNCVSIPFQRIGTRRYHGCVHGWVTLHDVRHGNATFQVVTTNKIGEMDGAHADRVLVRNVMLLKCSPYRGDVRTQIGLFSVESEGKDMVEPYLTLLKNLSDAAGVGIVSQALHFVRPIQEGLNLLLGADKGLTLEVGLDDANDPLVSGTYLLARAALHDIDQLTIDEEYRLLDTDGKVINRFPYVIFTISGLKHRNDWRSIPEIIHSHQKLKSFFEGKRIDEQSARDQLRHFKMTCINSPDLIRSDARSIADGEADAYKEFLPRHKMAGVEREASYRLWELEDLHPFPEVEEIF